MNIIDWSFLIFLFIMMPPGIHIFTKRQMSYKGMYWMISRYKWHMMVIWGIYGLKNLLDLLNDPIRDLYQLDYTGLIYAVEGNAALHLQNALLNPYLTAFFVIIYTLGFIFVFNFSFFLFAYVNEKSIAGKLVFINLIITFMTVFFYLFVPVFVTSWPAMDHSLDPAASPISGIQGMRPLLYEWHPAIGEFFRANDPFDNCFPSLHVAMPASMAYIIHRENGKYRNYMWFLIGMTVIIAIAILYLGIHWIIDIPAGLAIIPPALWITDRYSDRFFNGIIDRWEEPWQKYIGRHI